MPFATNKTFTLGDLAKISLGADELTNDHLSVLQSVLIILLQKLNCHNETVHIEGPSAKCVKELIENNSNCSQYNFELKKIKRFQPKYRLLEDLERKTRRIDFKMKKHMERIHNCRRTNLYEHHKWDAYASPAGDLCTYHAKDLEEYCLFVRDPSFNRGLLNRIMPPIIERFQKLESKIALMGRSLQKITQMADNIEPHFICIEMLIKDIEDIRYNLSKAETTFNETINEIQEMSNCKLQRQALPALKRYLDRHFAAIGKQLTILKMVPDKALIMQPLVIEDKKTCLSCHVRRQEYQTLKSSIDERKDICVNSLKNPILGVLQKVKKKTNEKLNAVGPKIVFNAA